MASAPAKLLAPNKLYGEGIRQEKLRIAVLFGQPPSPHGAVDLSEAKKNKAVLLPEDIVAASKLAAEYANREFHEKESMSPVEQSAAVAAMSRLSITGKAGKVLGPKNATVSPPPLPMSHQANVGMPQLHVQALDEPMDVAKRTGEDKKKGRFSVRAMMGKELCTLKAMTGIQSKKDKRREQLKRLIRVVEADGQEKENRGPLQPNMPMRDAPKVPDTQHIEAKEEMGEIRPGLKEIGRASCRERVF